MKFNKYTGITWSLLELTGLLEDEDSRVCFERIKKHLGLHPFHLTDLHTALNEILSSNLNSYDPELKGFLLAYKNPKLLTPLGDIFYDTCFIHVDVEADFYIFRPEVGCSLKGVVNKKGLDHVGVLVHKAFNVSIQKPNDDGQWPGDVIDIGQEVRFKITQLDHTTRLPIIRGVLDPETYLEGCRINPQNSTCNRREYSNANSQDSRNSVNEEAQPSRPSKASPKRNKQFFFASDSESASEKEEVETKQQILPKKKSKKNKSPEREIVLDVDVKKEGKKKAPKSAEIKKESKPKLIKMETVKHRLFESTVTSTDESDISQKVLSKKRSSKKPRDSSPTVKREDEKSSGKSAEGSTFEDNVKAIKRSTKKKHSNSVDVDDVLPSPVKRPPKRLRVSDSESEEAPVTVKTEKANVAVKRIQETDDESSSKAQLKKSKNLAKTNSCGDGVESESPKRNSPKKRAKKADFEFATPSVKIKKERLNSVSENTTGVDVGKVKNTGANESLVNSEQDEGEAKSPRKKKKHADQLVDFIKVEPGFEGVTVKVEKPDKVAKRSPKKTDEKTTPTDSPKKRLAANSKDGAETDEVNSKAAVKLQLKTEKATSKETKLHSVKIKTEKSAATDSAGEESLKKVIANHKTAFSIEASDDRDKKSSPSKRSSPTKQKSVKSVAEFPFGNVKIKVEKSANS